MNRRLISYLIFYSLAFGIACPAPLMAMSKSESKSGFARFKDFRNAVTERYGKIGREDVHFLYNWAKQKFNQKMRGGQPTTAEQDTRAKSISSKYKIEIGAILAIIVASAVAATVKTVSYVRNKRAEAAANAKKLREKEIAQLTGTVVKTRENYQLMVNIANYSPTEIKKLLDAGADINYEDSNGATPLILAAMLGNRNAIVYLVNKGADKKLKNKDGKTALDLANTALQHNNNKQNDGNGIKKYKTIIAALES